MDRLTTDNRETNLQTLLNYAYAKDRAVHLAYGNGEDNIPLDEYIAHEASAHGCPKTTTEVMEGGCMECDCPIAILNAVAIQAAELRGRLMMIEDILGDTYDLDHLRELIEADREDRLKVLPCKVGDHVYWADSTLHEKPESRLILSFRTYGNGNDWIHCLDREFRVSSIGKTIFLTPEEAQAALAKDTNVPTKKEEEK